MEMIKSIKNRLTQEPVKGREWIYIRQSLFAAIYIGVAFWLMELLGGIHLFPCLAATAFIVFVFPQSPSSSPKYLIGGYIVACIVGAALGTLGRYLVENHVMPLRPDIILSVVTVFLVMLLMSILDFEHPPAAAMAATLTLMDTPYPTAVGAFASVVVLCIIKRIFIKYLHNL